MNSSRSFIEELVNYVNPFLKNIIYNILELTKALINIKNNDNEIYIFINFHSQFNTG